MRGRSAIDIKIDLKRAFYQSAYNLLSAITKHDAQAVAARIGSAVFANPAYNTRFLQKAVENKAYGVIDVLLQIAPYGADGPAPDFAQTREWQAIETAAQEDSILARKLQAYHHRLGQDLAMDIFESGLFAARPRPAPNSFAPRV